MKAFSRKVPLSLESRSAIFGLGLPNWVERTPSEQMLKNSLFAVGRMSGLSDREIELDWQRICLDAQFNVQFADIHIE